MKQYDITHLINELAEGKSLFFSNQPKREEPTRQQNPAAPEQGERPNGRTVEREANHYAQLL
jgi:hypothetical protein